MDQCDLWKENMLAASAGPLSAVVLALRGQQRGSRRGTVWVSILALPLTGSEVIV